MTDINTLISNRINTNISNKVYYTVNNRIFYNVYAAFLYAAHNCFHKHVYFHVFNDEFDKVDWTIYPKTSYKDLFRMRAMQIRKKYNKVGILYSGGTDSTTALASFLDNDITLDFIVILINRATSSLKQVFDAKTLTDWIETRWPVNSKNIKFIFHNFSDVSPQKTLFGQESFLFSENSVGHIYFFPPNFHDGIKSKIDNEFSYNWGLITGHEVPSIYNDRSYFIDKDFVHMLNKDYIEFFFLSPELPEISVKQSHDYAKFNALTNETTDKCWGSSFSNANNYTLKKSALGCEKEPIKNLSYHDKLVLSKYRDIVVNTDFRNKKNINIFEQKIRSTIYGYYHNTNENTSELANWYNGLAAIASDKTMINYMVTHGYLDNHEQPPHAYNGLMSKQRKIF